MMTKSFGARQRVAQDENNGISSEKHLGDVSILVDGFRLLLSLPRLRNLGPELFHVFQHHVAMTIEGLHSSQEFLVVPTIDEHLHEQRPNVAEKV